MSKGLLESIEDVLPKSDLPWKLLNLQSIPKKSKPIIFSSGKHKPDTIKIQHFIVLFHNEIPIFGIEVFVYITLHQQKQTERVIFVAKADTVGLSPMKIKVGEIISLIISWILQIPIPMYLSQVRLEDHGKVVLKPDHPPFRSEIDRALHILAERARGNTEYGKAPHDKDNNNDLGNNFKISDQVVTKICLFTRAEPQYMFPNSNKNSGKHLLSGEGLLKWWLKLLSQTIANNFESISLKALNILNAEQDSIRRYFPDQDWRVGDVFSGSDMKTKAVYRIPLLPDDPKGRFLENLVVENRIKKIKLNQFWTELSIRQEFRLGATVGLIGIEGISKANDHTNPEEVIIIGPVSLGKIKSLLIEVDYSSDMTAKEGFKGVQTFFGEKHDFFELKGKKDHANNIGLVNAAAPATVNTINTLTVRSNSKKRETVTTQQYLPVVNDLTSMVVRKKPKVSK